MVKEHSALILDWSRTKVGPKPAYSCSCMSSLALQGLVTHIPKVHIKFVTYVRLIPRLYI
jgi:hypothetical protein